MLSAIFYNPTLVHVCHGNKLQVTSIRGIDLFALLHVTDMFLSLILTPINSNHIFDMTGIPQNYNVIIFVCRYKNTCLATRVGGKIS